MIRRYWLLDAREAYMRNRLVATAAVAIASAYGCGGTPTTPAPLLAISCSEVVNGYQCGASVLDGPTSTQPRDVTGLATWSTSDPRVATVNSVGWVTVVATGDVAIRASYRGAEDFLRLSVRQGGASYYFRALSGWTTDARDGSKLSGVQVRILDGPNMNRTSSSGADGAYQMYDLELGTFTVRFTKTGYNTLDQSVTLSGDKFTGLDAQLTRTP